MNKVLMPRMGSSMERGKIVRWLKKEGDRVEKGDMIAEIETEKVTIEIESFASGILRKIVAREGETVPVGGLIALIGSADEPLPPTEELVSAKARAEAAPAAEREAKGARVAVPAAPERVAVSPVARRLAEEHGINLAEVKGTGPGGRIVKEDIERIITEMEKAARPSALRPAQGKLLRAEARRPGVPKGVEGVEEMELTPMRRAIAHQMTQSKQTVPHFYVTMEVNVTEAERMRRALNELESDESKKVSVNDLVVAAVGRALKKFPQVNASFAGETIKMKRFVNVGIAIALDQGLVVPVLRDADKKSLREIARETKHLAEGARKGRLAAEEVTEATFTVTNLGVFGVDNFLAIINPPESAILAVGAIEKEPVVVDGNISVAERMKLTLSGDHRVMDGATGARFLQEVKELLEKPLSLIVG